MKEELKKMILLAEYENAKRICDQIPKKNAKDIILEIAYDTFQNNGTKCRNVTGCNYKISRHKIDKYHGVV